MLVRFIELGRILTRRQRGTQRPDDIRGASESWLAIIPFVRRTKRPRERMRSLAPAPRRRRVKRVANVGPAKQIVRRAAPAAPERPKDWRAKAIAIAWKQRDWWTLRDMSEISEVPEI